MKILNSVLLNYNLNSQFQNRKNFVTNSIAFNALYSTGKRLQPSELAKDDEFPKEIKAGFENISTGINDHCKKRKEIEEQIEILNTKIELLDKFAEKLTLDYKQITSLIGLARSKKPENFNLLVEKTKEIYLTYTEQETVDQELVNSLASIIQKILRKRDILDLTSDEIIKKIRAEINLKTAEIKLHARDVRYQAPVNYHLTQEQANSECFIDLNKNSEFSKEVKLALKTFLDKVYLGYFSYVVNNQKNRDFLANFDNKTVYRRADFAKTLGVDKPEKLFADCKIYQPDKRIMMDDEIYDPTLLTFPKGHISEKILEDIEANRVAPYFWYNENYVLPLVFKKYSNGDEIKPYDKLYVDLEDKHNKKILNYSPQMKKHLSELPFEISQGIMGRYIDLNSEHNKEVMNFGLHSQYPKASKYYISEATLSEGKRFDIPVEYLESMGYGKAEQIIRLIRNKQIKGGRNSDNKYFVSMNHDVFFLKSPELKILNELRAKNRKMVQFRDFAKGLNIFQKRLNFAVITGEVEIIEEYLTAYDKEARYIDISRPKNQEFIKKIRFEQTLKKSMSEAQRQENEKKRIEKQDVYQRLQGIRMSLVWEFMPNTREVASTLAKQDGYLCKLLAKEDESDEALTPHEEAKINSYRKEMWLKAGVDELNQAHKKASEIMAIYKEQGINGVDKEYHPIFEKYGFC